MKRVVFLDYLRTIAIFMVLIVHSCENFYYGENGSLFLQSPGSARWAIGLDSACRACVPLFVMASSYLLFPIKRETGDFLRRRLLRVGIPFVVWCCIFTIVNHGEWAGMLFNFPMTAGGHLWFVPMILGVYLLMPLLSPWAERVSEKELRGWIILWIATTTIPFVRQLYGHLYGTGWGHIFGEATIFNTPFLFGECHWNTFGTFYYVSGFMGYLLLGLWFRKFAPEYSWKKTLAIAIPLWLIGFSIVAGWFYFRIPAENGYPATGPYPCVVDLETSWENCSLGVVMTVIAYFLIIRKMTFEGKFYKYFVLPFSEASFGIYLIHMLFLGAICGWFSGRVGTGCAIICTAAATFITAFLVAYPLHKIPKLGKWIAG